MTTFQFLVILKFFFFLSIYFLHYKIVEMLLSLAYYAKFYYVLSPPRFDAYEDLLGWTIFFFFFNPYTIVLSFYFVGILDFEDLQIIQDFCIYIRDFYSNFFGSAFTSPLEDSSLEKFIEPENGNIDTKVDSDLSKDKSELQSTEFSYLILGCVLWMTLGVYVFYCT